MPQQNAKKTVYNSCFKSRGDTNDEPNDKICKYVNNISLLFRRNKTNFEY